jgi:septal ring factor EnvC (AmiA/AmiB activator)
MIAKLKDLMGLLREATIAILLLLFLFWPSMVRGILENAGVHSMDFAGLQVELEQSAKQTQTATTTVADLQKQLDALNSRLEQVSQSPAATPEVKQQIATLSQDLGKTQAQTKQVQNTLRESLTAQRSVIQRVNPALAARIYATPTQ